MMARYEANYFCHFVISVISVVLRIGTFFDSVP